MGRQQQFADTWQTDMIATIDTVVAAILDIIDTEPSVHVHTRTPTKPEIAATIRDMYQWTPRGRSRQTDTPRPVEDHVIRRELEAQRAVTMLDGWAADCQPLSDVPLPGPLPERTAESGRQVDATFGVCRRHVLDLHGWTHGMVAEAALKIGRSNGADVFGFRVQQANAVRMSLRALARRVAPDRPVQRRCVCGCGRVTVAGEGATHPACRKRRQRERLKRPQQVT